MLASLEIIIVWYVLIVKEGKQIILTVYKSVLQVLEVTFVY